MQNYPTNYNLPDNRGHFEEYGGKFVPETLIPALHELEEKYLISKKVNISKCPILFLSRPKMFLLSQINVL